MEASAIGNLEQEGAHTCCVQCMDVNRVIGGKACSSYGILIIPRVIFHA